jgi:hypothetical protein
MKIHFKKIPLTFLMIVFALCTVSAQQGAIAFQVTAGSQGLGGDIKYGILRNLSVRGGASFLPVSANNVFTFSGFNSDNDLSAKFSNAHLLFDFSPFRGSSAFRIVAGGGYFFKGDGTLNVQPTGTYYYGDIPVTSAELGQVTATSSWAGFAPYLGIGLFRGFSNHLFNVNLDLGTYYLSQPRVTVVGTGMLSGNSSQAPVIAGNLSDYRFLPVLQLNFNFKIHSFSSSKSTSNKKP